jgi:hypothetical protein
VKTSVIRLTLLLLLGFAIRAEAQPASGYWWNPAQAGSGFVIEVQGTTLFMAGFLYNADGGATWVGSTGPMTSTTQYSGSLLTYAGGQMLTGVYQAPVGTPSPGDISLTFSSSTQGSLTWPGGTIPIQRFDIAPGGSTTAQPSTNPQTGWWWNSQQPGRGFAVEVQNGQMYLAGYMYDGAGNPVWYLASGPMTSATLFQGAWTEYGGGQTLTGSYVAPSLIDANVGSVTLAFANNSSAALTLPDGSEISLTRFNFGFSAIALAAFSPGSAAPNSQLTITGTGFDPSQTVTLTAFDNNGYTITLPPVAVSTTSLTFSVPGYINPTTGAFGSGVVSLQAQQSSGSTTLQSNVLQNFQIQPLPTAGVAGQSTLAMLQASLAEAQRLQTAIVNTPQNSATVQAALATQVGNLQTLVTNVQSVVQNGASFSLGVVGGVDVTVNSSNIGDVDNLILASMQALSGTTGTGSQLRQKTTATPTCLSAEAGAYAQAAAAGAQNLATLAQNLLEAPASSTACAQTTAALAAYRTFTGPHLTALATLSRAGLGGKTTNVDSSGVVAALVGNASTHVAINALAAQSNTSSRTSVRTGVADVNRLEVNYYATLLSKTGGPLLGALQSAQSVSDAVAPPVAAAVEADLAAISNQFSALTALTANPNEIASDPLLLALYDSSAFINNGQSLNTYLTGLFPALPGGYQFTDAEILSASPAKNPTTATVLVTMSAGGSPRNFPAFVMNNVNGTWLNAGNGQQAQALATTYARIVGSGAMDTGLSFVVRDQAPLGISYAIVTGQALPTSGLLLVNGEDGNTFYLAQPPYQGTGSLTPALNVGTPGRTQYPLTDAEIDTIFVATPYTIQLWNDNGTPGNQADDKLIATYTSYLTIRPRLNSELVAGDFVTVNNSAQGVGNFADAGGTFTVKWQQPVSKAAEYVEFYRTLSTNGVQNLYSVNVVSTAKSATFTVPPPAATISSSGVTIVIQDAYLRELMTVFSGQ